MKRLLASLAVAALTLSPLAFGHVNAAQALSPQFVAACPALTPSTTHCFAIRVLNPPSQPDSSPPGLHPADLQSAYKLPSSTAGSGQTVAVVDVYDDPNAESDLAVYRSTFGLPPCTTANGCFKKVNEFGQTSPLPPANPSGGWQSEESLDVDMVSAICPKCKIILVEAFNPTNNPNDNANLVKGVDASAALGANAISNSYGNAEWSGELSLDQHYNHPGIAVTVSSGDSGYGPAWPAASEYVTAVGGTSLRKASTARGWTETAWSGAGSGCSKYVPKQSWQTDSLCANRTIADVSAVADPGTGVSVYDTFQSPGWEVFGGTSVASPIIASVYALAGNAGSVTYGSYPYSHTGSLFDVTKGSNGSCGGSYLCTAGPGYDGPTGLGTPNGTGGF